MSSTFTSPASVAHSAQVEMYLIVQSARLPIAQLGRDFLILSETAPPALAAEGDSAEAEIVLQVDASERRWRVELPDGLAAAGRRTRIVNER